MAGFPAEFIEGMAKANRSRFLGDVGESDSRSWAWGGPQGPPIDGLILAYATTPDVLAQRQSVLQQRLAELGIRPRLRLGLHVRTRQGRRARAAQRADRVFPRLAPNGKPTGQERSLADPEGLLTFLVFRPLSDLFLWLWRLERRTEFLYRPRFDKWLRPPLFAWAQALQNSRRQGDHLGLAQEQLLPGEEQYIRATIDEIAKFTRENWLPGGAQRFGNTKTFGVLRGDFSVLPGLPANCASSRTRTNTAQIMISPPATTP